MGISVSSKKKQLSTLEPDKQISRSGDNLEQNLKSASCKCASFSSPDSGYSRCVSEIDADSGDVMNTTFSDIISMDERTHSAENEYVARTKQVKHRFDEYAETSSMIQENGIDFSFITEDTVFDCESLKTIDLPGVVTNTLPEHTENTEQKSQEKSTEMGRRRRHKSNTSDPKNRPRAASVEGRLQRLSSRPNGHQYNYDNKSSDKNKQESPVSRLTYPDCDIQVDTKNPSNRPGAARAEHRSRTQSRDLLDSPTNYQSDDVTPWLTPRSQCTDQINISESPDNRQELSLMDAFILFLRERPSLLSDALCQDNSKRNNKKLNEKCGLKVTVNPSSKICQISLPGALIFNGIKSNHQQQKHSIKRNQSMIDKPNKISM